jgi:ribosomal protein S18 acetylase RimI-like enzyme
MKVIEATLKNIEELTQLFDLYRQFYQEEPNLEKSKNFIRERLINKDSKIYMACDDNDRGLGFVQLYPLFCSIACEKIWLLNDLFVSQSKRQSGIGRLLMKTAANFVQENGGKRVDLATAKSNLMAQRLYESLGYIRDNDFFTYSLAV